MLVLNEGLLLVILFFASVVKHLCLFVRLLEIKDEDGHAILSYNDVTSAPDAYDSDDFDSSFGDPLMDAKFSTFAAAAASHSFLDHDSLHIRAVQVPRASSTHYITTLSVRLSV